MADREWQSTIDVLEGFFGGTPTRENVMGLTCTQIEELGDRTREYVASTDGEPAPVGTMYPGGWVAGNWMSGPFTSDLNLALLYHPNVLVHDPVAEYFFDGHDWLPEMRSFSLGNGGSISAGPKLWGAGQTWVNQRENLDQARNTLANLISRYVDFSPLAKAGILVPRSQWPTVLKVKESLLTSVRHDVRNTEMRNIVATAAEASDPLPIWDNLRGMNVAPYGGLIGPDRRWANQYEFFHFAKNLAVASDSGSLFMPQNRYEVKLLQAKIGNLLPTVPKREILQEVASFLVPGGNIDAKTAVKIRQNDGDFEDWRSMLRLVEQNSSGDSPAEIGERVRDEMGQIVRRIKKSDGVGARSRLATKEAAATFVISVIGGAQGGLGSALTAGASTGAAFWLWKYFNHESETGSDAVIASLMRSPCK